MLIWLIIAAVLALLMLCPVRVHATLFDGVATIKIRYLFFTVTLIPAPPKKERPKPKPKTKTAKKKPRGSKKPDSAPKKWDYDAIMEVAETAKKALSTACAAAKTLLRGLHIDVLRLEVITAGRNAAAAGVKCGLLCAAVYPAADALRTIIPVRRLYINIFPGAWLSEDCTAFEAKAHIRPIRVVMAAGVLIGGLLPLLTSFIKQQNKL